MRAALLFIFALLATGAFGQPKQKNKELVQAPAVKAVGKPLYTNSHALIIGINKYKSLGTDLQLSYAVNDAQALRDVLVQGYGFPAENVTVLTDEQATLANIRDALAAFADTKKVGSDDRLVIYFSGHGQTVQMPGGGEMGYLIPSDAQVDLNDPTNSSSYLRSCLPMRQVWEYLAASPAKHALVVADACFSGLLTATRGGISRETANVLLTRRARQVLTGGSKGEKTVERSDLGHGIFTAKLLSELKARAQNPGVAFTTSDLYASIQASVANSTNGKQNPKLGVFEEDGEVLFAPGGKFTTVAGEPVPSKPEPKKPEPKKPEPKKPEPKKPEPAKPESPKADPPKAEPVKQPVVNSGPRRAGQPRIVILPIQHLSGEKWEELKAKQIAKGQEYLMGEFGKRDFNVATFEEVKRLIDQEKIDLSDEEQHRRSTFFEIAKKLDADYIIFGVITATSQKKQARMLYVDTEGETQMKVWLLDVRGDKPIISAKTFTGRSGGNRMSLDNKGSDRQIQATANALRDALKEFFKDFPVVNK